MKTGCKKEIVEGEGGENRGQEARSPACIKTADHDREKEAGGGGVQGPGDGKRESAASYRQTVTTDAGDHFHLPACTPVRLDPQTGFFDGIRPFGDSGNREKINDAGGIGEP